MSKSDYITFVEHGKKSAKRILEKYHYLTGISKGFKSGYNFVLFSNKLDRVVGVCIFTGFPVPELAKGCYGLKRDQQEGLFELSRLCLDPEAQKEEHNLASWFTASCMRKLRKLTLVKSILSYADDGYHKGTVYQALNFKYYGLTAKKKDFWVLQDNGSYTKLSRGKTKGIAGEWRDRTRKHRYLITYDKKLNCQWEEQKHPVKSVINHHLD